MGGHGARLRGVESAVPGQRAAVESHADFIRHIARTSGPVCDVLVRSYTTRYNSDLCTWYRDGIAPVGGKVLDCAFEADMNPEGLPGLLRTSLSTLPDYGTVTNCDFPPLTSPRKGASYNFPSSPSLILNASGPDGGRLLSEYGFVVVSRIDILYKPLLKAVVDPFSTTIDFLFNLWFIQNKYGYTELGFPRVTDMFYFFPRRHFCLLELPIEFHNHDIWQAFMTHPSADAHHPVLNQDMRLLIRTLHDADSAKDWNPLLYVVNREMCCKWINRGWEMPESGPPATEVSSKTDVATYFQTYGQGVVGPETEPCLAPAGQDGEVPFPVGVTGWGCV